ncbi:hypothetical protein N875_10720 [Neisseria meningitidis LNP21362]|nr:hypothetical protein N875_10720 [Neisseria meningitidis LNP21362]
MASATADSRYSLAVFAFYHVSLFLTVHRRNPCKLMPVIPAEGREARPPPSTGKFIE